jgi:hypothetical protein
VKILGQFSAQINSQAKPSILVRINIDGEIQMVELRFSLFSRQ